MHLGLTLIGPLCPKSISGEPHGLAKVPDGPQAYTLNILRLQKKGAQDVFYIRGIKNLWFVSYLAHS